MMLVSMQVGSNSIIFNEAENKFDEVLEGKGDSKKMNLSHDIDPNLLNTLGLKKDASP